MPRFSIHHITKYTYEGPVRDSANRIVLFPIKDDYQEVLKQDLRITGEPAVDVYKDFYGNEVGSFTRAELHSSLIIDSKVEVITRPGPPILDEASLEEQKNLLEQIRWQAPYIDFLKQEPFDFLEELLEDAALPEAAALTPLAAASRLKTYVYDHFKYIKGVTTVETTLEEIWKAESRCLPGLCLYFAGTAPADPYPCPLRQRLYLSQ
jgi:transglutaminase-like putative cysteine protease